MPAPKPALWSQVTARAVIALCAFALLAVMVLGSVQPATASLSNQISANRSSQLYSASVMRSADQLLTRIRVQMKITRKSLKQAKRDVKRGKRAVALAKRVFRERQARLARVEALFEDPSAAPEPWTYKKRLRDIRREVRIAKARKAAIGKRLRLNTRARNARQYRSNALKRQRRVAIGRRESAEDALGYRIVQMTQLAAARAENQSEVTLTSGGGSFSWPSTGRISQTYGCTGFPLNPRRGSCRYFHSGLDIVDAYGSPVRAAAVGVVAYAGWNPWDEGARAWIVVVVHPDGFVSRYGHMTPTKRVRVGDLVYTGQVIGKMGNTGRSTGTHVHFELLKGKSTVSPFAYLPAGVVKIRIDKTTTKKGKAKAARKARAAKKAKAAKQARAAKKARRAAVTTAVTTLDPPPVACSSPTDQPLAEVYPYAFLFDSEFADPPAGPCAVEDVLAVAGSPAVIDPAGSKRDVRRAPPPEIPGVRLPPRGTSPIPR